MPLYVGLNIATLVMCVITLTLATAALMPQIKQGLQLLRDGLLWALLLGVIAFVGFIGWGRLFELRQGEMTPTTDAPLAEMFDFRLTSEPEPELDPLPLPTAQDQHREARWQGSQTIPVVQVSDTKTRMKVVTTTEFKANRSQKPPRRRISSTTGLNR